MVEQYRSLADFYDELFTPVRNPIDTAREHVLRRVLPTVETACDLACGTGETALKLARRGIKTYAVDLSRDMCRITREKARRTDTKLRVIRADMRSFRLPRPVDLITCEGDALNHVPRAGDLRLVANAVAQALRPGGHFFFDVNNSVGFERYWTGTWRFETPYAVVVMRNGHSRRSDKAWSDIELFIRNGNYWRRRHERVDEVCWSAEQVQNTFKRAGFDEVRAWDAAPFFKNSVVGPGCRTLYLARRSAAAPRSRKRLPQ